MLTHRGGKNNTDVEFATNYSDYAHISQVSFCTICAGDNVAFVAAGCLIRNHISISGAIFIIRQLYLIFFSLFLRQRDPGLFPKHLGL